MEPVDLTEQCGTEMSTRELSQEMPGPLNQREACLFSEGADVDEPGELVLL